MSKCDLSIELESGAVRYQPGDVVRGHVLVDVDAECTCKKLNVVLQWRTPGSDVRDRDKGEPLKQTPFKGVYKKLKGVLQWHLPGGGVRNRDKGEPLKQTLFEGVWRPGEQQGYPFEFTVPDGPLSYHGEILNVDWHITATADIPRAFDQKAEAEIFVHRGSYTGPLSVGNDRKHQQSQEWLSQSRGDRSNRMDLVTWVRVGIFAVFLVPMLCMGIGVAIVGLLKVQKDPSAGNIFLLILGSVLILVPAIVLVFFLRWRKMKRKLGNVEVAAEATNTGTSMKIFLCHHFHAAGIRVPQPDFGGSCGAGICVQIRH